MRFIYLITFHFLLVCLVSPAAAQVKFSASVSPGKIGMQDYATVQFTISGSLEIEHIYPPDLKAVELVSGPHNELSEVEINGKKVGNFSLYFIVKPRKPGRLTFPGAKARIAGKEYQSNPVSLEVLKIPTTAGTSFEERAAKEEEEDALLQPDENVEEKVKKNMVLKLETSKKKVYVGEPVLAEFKLYSRLKSNSRITSNPSFNGFSVVDLQTPVEADPLTARLGEKEYNVYSLRKVLLYPLQPGTYTIDRLELENQVQFLIPGPPPDPYDLFSMMNGGQNNAVFKMANLESQPGTIVVVPLPEKNKPASFSGAVGKFSIQTRMAKDSFHQNEEGRLVMEISGNGNLQLVNAPAIQWPDGVEVFDPQVKDTLFTESNPVTGRKTLEYSFSALKPGRYFVPPVAFDFFDPEKEEYVTIHSKPLSFTVGPPEMVLQKANQVTAAPSKESRSITWWLLTAAAAVAAMLLFMVFKNLRKEHVAAKRKDVVEPLAAQPAFRLPESPLERSSALCHEGDSRDFYLTLNNELKHWLSQKFCLDTNEASLDKLLQCMDQKNVPNHFVLEAQQLLREIEWQLYAPAGSHENMPEHFARARRLVQDIDVA